MRAYRGFTECYQALVRAVHDTPQYVCKPGDTRPAGRGGGQEIREIICEGFTLLDPRDRLPCVAARDLSLSYAVAELLWYVSGSDSTDWISYYAPFWRSISDDGKTANSAYGARIFRKDHDRIHGSSPGQSQWEYVKEELTRDPESRRAVIHIRTPQDSWLAKKDVPCTLSLQFFVRNGRLDLVASMRSSDLILGIPYDVIAFTFFQEMMALELGIELGTYTHVSNSLHLYGRDFELAEKICKEIVAPSESMPALPSLPPIDVLSDVEARLRTAPDATTLLAAISDASSLGLHAYWMDWVRILASNRAKKLGLPQMQRDMIRMTSWSGFNSFAR